MSWIDYAVVLSFLGVLVAIGLRFSRRSGSSSEEFIIAGRKLPWWLAGTSILANGFNAETPLHQSRKSAETGIAGNWFYWSFMLNAALEATLIGRMWRRTRLTTPVEFYSLRYSGRIADLNRVTEAVYSSVIQGSIWCAFGLIGLRKITGVLLDLPPDITILGFAVPTDITVVVAAVALALVYSAAAGVYGVVWTDLVEFAVAMLCSYLLMIFVLSEVGGGQELQRRIIASGQEAKLLSWIPTLGPVLLVYLLLWPFAGSGAVGNHAMRFLATRDENEVLRAGLWKIIAHYSLRSWPWIICGLCMLFLIGESDIIAFGGIKSDGSPDWELGYPYLIKTYMPVGLLGLMMAGILCAFLSSIDTNLHTGASIFLNDLYRPYFRRSASEAHYVAVMRLSLVLIALLSILVAFVFDDILELFVLMSFVVRGAGFMPLLRWFWWRVNGWADLTSRLGAIAATWLFEYGPGARVVDSILEALGRATWDADFAVSFVLIVGSVAALSLVVMILTPPVAPDTIDAFYRRVRPLGWWAPSRKRCPEVVPADSFLEVAGLTVLAMVFGITAILGVGAFILGDGLAGAASMAACIICGVTIVKRADSMHAHRKEDHDSAEAT